MARIFTFAHMHHVEDQQIHHSHDHRPHCYDQHHRHHHHLSNRIANTSKQLLQSRVAAAASCCRCYCRCCRVAVPCLWVYLYVVVAVAAAVVAVGVVSKAKDALAAWSLSLHGCSANMDGTMVRAWMHWHQGYDRVPCVQNAESGRIA